MPQTIATSRSAGVLLPLSSLRSAPSWGVGELPDLALLAPWLQKAKLSLLQILPLNEPALGQESPYSALSAFALDPLYLRLSDIPSFVELGGEAALPADDKKLLERVRNHATIDHEHVRALKEKWLRRAYARFLEAGHSSAATEPGRSLARFAEEHRGWLFDYALFRALKTRRTAGSWRDWEVPLRDRMPGVVEAAAKDLESERAFRTWIQWHAFGQLETARRALAAAGVKLAGDLPFLVAEDSADVWQRQREFSFDATVGVPPDAFSADGQDWGLPVYRWEAIAKEGFEWCHQRGRAAAKLYDLVRVDHVVGFYRTYVRPKDKREEHFFLPAEEAAQKKQGEAVLRAFGSGGAALIAEDLGVVPKWVRQSLTHLGVPGYKVMRWETLEGDYLDPKSFPPLSLVTSGTHDNEPLAAWWAELPAEEREKVRKLPALAKLTDTECATYGAVLGEAFLETAYGAGSSLCVLPMQDLFGWTDRINVPGTVGAQNWSWRLPFPIERLVAGTSGARETTLLAVLAAKHRRA